MTGIRSWLARLRAILRRAWPPHPRVAIAVRAAVAAGVAWLATGLIPDALDDYPYYAPFGAVIATTLSLAGSVRESLQAVAAMVTGGAVAMGVGLIPMPGPFGIALTVAASVLVGSLRFLGSMRSWVPTAAIFTLIIGQGDAFYIGSYALLTLLGAAIGVGVNLLFPPLPISIVNASLARVRQATADQLDLLADAFENPDEGIPEHDGWTAEELRKARIEMHDAVALVHDARRANRRVRYFRDTLNTMREESVRIDRVAIMVAELRDLLLHEQRSPAFPQMKINVPEEIWAPLISALRTTAASLRDPDQIRRFSDIASTRLDQIVRIRQNVEGEAVYLVDALILTLRRGWHSAH